MDSTKLIQKIGQLIDKKLHPVKQQLDNVEIKVELVNKRVEQTEQRLVQEIRKSQEDTIETLSELTHGGYNLHEKRIKKIEDHLGLPQTQ